MNKNLYLLIALFIPLFGINYTSAQTIFTVSSNSKSGTGSFIEAINLANNSPGLDTIRFTPNLQIDAAHSSGEINPAKPIMVQITESVFIDGNGGSLNGSQYWATSDGVINNTSFCPESIPSNMVLATMPGFVEIGIAGQNNSAIDVTITKLSIKQFNHIALIRDNATLRLDSFVAKETWASYSCGNESPLQVYPDASLHITKSNFINAHNWADEGIAAFIIGAGSGDLKIEGSYFENILDREQYLIDWVGSSTSTVNIVSSRIARSGGVKISGGVLATNIVNSSWVNYVQQTPKYGDRIINATDGNMNIEACSFMWNSNLCDVACQTFPNMLNLIENNGSGTINFKSTAIGFNFPASTGTTLNTLGGTGTFSADQYTFIEPTIAQNVSTLQTLTNQPNLITTTPGFNTPIALPSFDYDVEMLTPLFPGPFIDAIPSSEVLINPIDLNAIQVDVLGNPRIDANNKRDIGAIQLSLSPFLSLISESDGAVELTWNEPIHHNGLNIVRYEILYSETSGAGSNTVNITPPLLSSTINGLTNGVIYQFKVRVVYDNNGTEENGPYSNTVNATPIGLLETPSVNAIAGDAQVSLSWNQPSLGGRTFESYSIVWREFGATNYTGVQGLFNYATTNTVVTGLTNGTTYEFAVAINASNDVSLQGFATATPELGLGLNDVKMENITIYPNPINDYLFIELNEDFQIKIFSIGGKIVFEDNGSKKIDLTHISSGIYTVQIETKNSIFKRKVIKK